MVTICFTFVFERLPDRLFMVFNVVFEQACFTVEVDAKFSWQLCGTPFNTRSFSTACQSNTFTPVCEHISHRNQILNV